MSFSPNHESAYKRSIRITGTYTIELWIYRDSSTGRIIFKMGKYMAEKELVFKPKLEGDFRNRFYLAVSEINEQTTTEEILEIVDKEIKWVEHECHFNLEQRKKYRAIWYLFRDLVNASFRAIYDNGVLRMEMPSAEDGTNKSVSRAEIKKMLRSWMAESRHERIVAGKEFVNRMEKGSASKKPITELIADGKALAEKLERVKNGEITLAEAVDPHLELVEDKRDEGYSNQKLPDIWQYFRLTWSTAYENTPGRTVRYLIRDYAHPMHAVMGIASLENCTVQITARDDNIGWTTKAFSDRISNLSEQDKRKEFNKLLEHIEDGINSINTNDLIDEGELMFPSPHIISKLEITARGLDEKRKDNLRAGDEESEEKSSLGKISQTSEDMLYQKKRIEQLAKFLRAKITIQEFLDNGDVDRNSSDFCRSDNGTFAIYTALVAQKSKHIGSSMMELNVCGAIPPYNEILGGKLVALLATSPQVIHDYKMRYEGKQSEIASRMKGEPVYRPADLVFVGTTSLYYVGSSQYNRLKIPGALFGTDYDVKWEEMGITKGYGTMHVGRATTSCLNEAVGNDAKLINHVFGEGASPKFRLLTMGINKLLETIPGTDPKEFTKHTMKRIVYGACLAENSRRYLLGYDSSPKYYTDVNDYKNGTQKIIDFWRDRWLRSRLNYSPIFDRLKAFNKKELLVSKEFEADESIEIMPLCEEIPMPTINKDVKFNFVRSFYRGTSAFAENIPDELLSLIHVQTDLDSTLLQNIKDGKDVVLTGSAGDGKTHIIRVMRDELMATGKNPLIMLDASEKKSEEIYENWKKARDAKRPFIIAINAAVLYDLHDYCEKKKLGFAPASNAFRLMQNSITFHGDEIHYDDIVLYDLSQRNVLDEAFVRNAVKKLSNGELYEKCDQCAVKDACAAQKNRRLLNDDIFLSRLCFILNRISLQGYHATLRDLQSLISFLIFGDRGCSKLYTTAGGDGYSVADLLYDNRAKGSIFKAIHSSFDPVKISHPVYDELILANQIDKDSWSDNYYSPLDLVEATNVDAFENRKREFFFFNKKGDEYIKINDDIATLFAKFLKGKDKTMRREIVKKLDRFFQTGESEDLVIWAGHRYNNDPRKILFSIGQIQDNKFKIGRPVLQKDMAEGFSIAANYVRFEKAINQTDNIFLKIDYAMFELLTQAENGVPVFFMENDLVKKVWRFIEQLQSAKDLKGDRIDFSILDVETNERIRVKVDREEKQYLSLKIEHGDK